MVSLILHLSTHHMLKRDFKMTQSIFLMCVGLVLDPKYIYKAHFSFLTYVAEKKMALHTYGLVTPFWNGSIDKTKFLRESCLKQCLYRTKFDLYVPICLGGDMVTSHRLLKKIDRHFKTLPDLMFIIIPFSFLTQVDVCTDGRIEKAQSTQIVILHSFGIYIMSHRKRFTLCVTYV